MDRRGGPVSRKVAARAFVRAIKETTPCADCNEQFHHAAMQFDHVRGKKKTNIAMMVKTGRPISTIETEIAKCEVVCANCHSVRTFERNQYAEPQSFDETVGLRLVS